MGEERPLVAALVVIGMFLVGAEISLGEWGAAVLMAALFVFGILWVRRQFRGGA